MAVRPINKLYIIICDWGRWYSQVRFPAIQVLPYLSPPMSKAAKKIFFSTLTYVELPYEYGLTLEEISKNDFLGPFLAFIVKILL